MTSTPRERARAQTMSEIVRIARQHLVTDGAAGLSLRAIARDLGVVSSAVYRYVKSRDELLTLLLVEGYDELGDRVDEAVEAAPGDDPRGRVIALARAVRAWGLAEPASYALLFGSPVPGYVAPGERTTEPGTRVAHRLVRIVADADAEGRLRQLSTPDPAPTPALAAAFDRARADFEAPLPDSVITAVILVWSAIFGCVSFEVFGQYGRDAMGDPSTLFDLHVAQLADLLGL